MTRLLRHFDADQREDDGVVRFDDLTKLFQSMITGTSHWSIEAWISFLAKGGGPKKKVSVLLEPQFFLTFPVSPSNPGTFRRYSR